VTHETALGALDRSNSRLGLSSRPGVGASGVFEPRRPAQAWSVAQKGTLRRMPWMAACRRRASAGRRPGGMDAGAVQGFVDVDVAGARDGGLVEQCCRDRARGWRASASCGAAGREPVLQRVCWRDGGCPRVSGRRVRGTGPSTAPPRPASSPACGGWSSSPGHRAL